MLYRLLAKRTRGGVHHFKGTMTMDKTWELLREEQREAGERNARGQAAMITRAAEERTRRAHDISRDVTDTMVMREYMVTNYEIGIYLARGGAYAPPNCPYHPSDLVEHRKDAAKELRRRKITIPPLAETLMPDDALRWNVDRTGIVRKEQKRRQQTSAV